jgi:superfamily II DNA/RNA helicase
MGLAPELLAAVADLGFTQPTTVQEQCIGRPWAPARPARRLHRPDGLQPDRQRQDRGLPAARAAHAAASSSAAEAADKQAYDEAIARGEAAPKRKRKNPLNPRNFKAAVPGALILCPTRELAQQVAHDAIDLVKHCRACASPTWWAACLTRCRSPACRTPTSWSPPRPPAGPAALGQIKLDQVQFLVVDEADRMLDLGFAEDLAEVQPADRQPPARP